MDTILEVKDLHVDFETYAGTVQAVRGVSFSLKRGETIAIVGESGCGKTVTAQTIMQLIPMPPGKVRSGQILFEGEDLLHKTAYEMQSIRGHDVGMIFQDPMTSLNPTMTAGAQIAEGIITHKDVTSQEAWQQAIDMLKLVGIPQPEKRATQYPHEFSGGMRQRIMIAIALACRPKLLIADEPTTALDVTIQAQIIELMKDIQKQMGTSIILITHDLGVVASMADRVVVMYAGKVVETGGVDAIFTRPQHPYTRALLQSIPRPGLEKSSRLSSIEGTPPNLLHPPIGCSFCPRCPEAMRICTQQDPILEPTEAGTHMACWLSHPQAKARRHELSANR